MCFHSFQYMFLYLDMAMSSPIFQCVMFCTLPEHERYSSDIQTRIHCVCRHNTIRCIPDGPNNVFTMYYVFILCSLQPWSDHIVFN